MNVCDQVDTGLETGMGNGHTESRRGSIGGDLQALRPLPANFQPVLPTTGLCRSALYGWLRPDAAIASKAIAGLCEVGRFMGYGMAAPRCRQPSPKAHCTTPTADQPDTLSSSLGSAVPACQESRSRVFYGWLSRSNRYHEIGKRLEDTQRAPFVGHRLAVRPPQCGDCQPSTKAPCNQIPGAADPLHPGPVKRASVRAQSMDRLALRGGELPSTFIPLRRGRVAGASRGKGVELSEQEQQS